MKLSSSQPLSRFNACWLAEAMRLRELDGGHDDAAGGFTEPLQPGQGARSDQDWLLRRALVLGRDNGLLPALHAWRRHAGWILTVLGALAVVSGFTAALGFFGAADRSVNVIWTLLGLIALPTLALLLWVAGLVAGGQSGGGASGRLWLWLAALSLRSGDNTASAPSGYVTRALAAQMNRSGLAQWWLSFITHSLWLLALLATLTGMLLALSLRSYGFVLETTILSPEVFTRLVQGFGTLPSMLGFAVPDADMIASALAGDVTAQTEAARRAWSSWLSGGVLVYAIAPRLLVWIISIMRLQRLRGRLELDLHLPGHASLLVRNIAPATPGIVDAAPPLPASARVAELHHVKGRQSVLLGLELRGDILWPPALVAAARHSFTVAEVVDSREQRRSTLALFAANPPARLLLACDARLSPDRGTLHWLIELSQRAGELRIWLLAATSESRLQTWRDSLADIGLGASRVITDEAVALHWLNHDE